MAARVRPPLKWAGGKFRLLDRLLAALPPGRRLVEPFVGSGALYLNAAYPAYRLCDLNPDLILFHRTLAAEGEVFIRRCAALFSPAANSPEAYYRARGRFNNGAEGGERAALFLYLNRHGYNGLVRYNARGVFNVPFGRYKAPRFPLDELRAAAARARGARVEFAVADFRATFAALEPGDVVYCDPPYAPLSKTADFADYTGLGFGADDQAALAKAAEDAARRGVTVVVSNHDTPGVLGLHRGAAKVERFAVGRSISCRGRERGPAPEVLLHYLPSRRRAKTPRREPGTRAKGKSDV